MLETGTMIGGKYKVLKRIGKGGMSSVYLALEEGTDKKYAIKAYEKEEIVLKSALAEVKVLKKLSHPLLPHIETILVEPDAFNVVMEYIEGETLSAVLEKKGAQPPEAVVGWTKELCEMLTYLHTRRPPVIYRDMKPANIMLLPDGQVRLIDFGIAREYKEKKSQDTMCLGTKGYAAPEQFYGNGQTDQRTDIYGLGATMYCLLTGQNASFLPFEHYPVSYFKPEVPEELERIVQKCIRPNPKERYQSCKQLRKDLDGYEQLMKKAEKEKKKKRIRKTVKITADVLLAALLLFEIFLLWQNGSLSDLWQTTGGLILYGKYFIGALIGGTVIGILTIISGKSG